jgi:hypothetical protein
LNRVDERTSTTTDAVQDNELEGLMDDALQYSKRLGEVPKYDPVRGVYSSTDSSCKTSAVRDAIRKASFRSSTSVAARQKCPRAFNGSPKDIEIHSAVRKKGDLN